ncbi:hypothetical protein KAU18_09195, partial [Candidatus Bathyarchaeota archaeon]|nr:hypothetical protein [Candidatus Bathyarchaeota archaeon]
NVLGVRNGYLIMDNAVLLERIDYTRYLAHGPSNDGYELTLEYDEDGQAKSISFGTTTLLRYTPETPKVDSGLELKGIWTGEYYDASGFHTLELTIEDEAHGTVKEIGGETMSVDELKAAAGKITGVFRYSRPKEYARWGTSDYYDVSLELNAINGMLKGVLRVRGMATLITLEKTS